MTVMEIWCRSLVPRFRNYRKGILMSTPEENEAFNAVFNYVTKSSTPEEGEYEIVYGGGCVVRAYENKGTRHLSTVEVGPNESEGIITYSWGGPDKLLDLRKTLAL